MPRLPDQPLTLEEIAADLRVSTATVRRMVDRPAHPLPAFQVGRSWRVDADAYAAWKRPVVADRFAIAPRAPRSTSQRGRRRTR